MPVTSTSLSRWTRNATPPKGSRNTSAGVAYSFPQGRKGRNYAVEHSSAIALFDPDARLHAVFTSPHKAEEIVEGFRKILRRRP